MIVSLRIHLVCALLLVVFSSEYAEASTLEILSQQMSSDSYEERSKAHRKLMKLAVQKNKVTATELFQLYRSVENPEAQERMREILEILVVRERYGVGSGFVGIRMGNKSVGGVDDKVINGIIISQVTPDSPASNAGLQRDDLIIAVDDLEAFTGGVAMREFRTYIMSKQPGDEARLTILRAGQKIQVSLLLGRFPDALKDENRFRRHRMRNQLSERDFFNKWLADKLRHSKK